MCIHIWEWIIEPNDESTAYGVSGTLHGAMETLAKTLISAGSPADGHVIALAIRDGINGWYYDRLESVHTAHYENGVITWK